MASESINLLKQQCGAYIDSLLLEGQLDEQFKQVQMLQDANNPGFVISVINIFCEDFENILAELSQLLDKETPDYGKVDVSVYRLKGSSASMGAHQVKLACTMLCSCCDAANKDGCKGELNTVKQKFYILKDKLQTLIQLERRIQELENGVA
ncbi:histidine-containing phosphotransfer protein 1-like [Nymphaea colorata]|nr:histidine-containing phosphotransfer protein 1-like [Nymphaea colorata]